ncbi:NAD-dependent epimerase/dehydratase family protein [Actinopolyspora mzabensis]|uniref:NAD-dependent epimerase/dehydratase family protein n=1 Tax=Actinopolyspora mzabensis TaxID=995066 RepID=UPI000B841BB4|nr:NAD-dependent epimerase/dehydratase family protein [Actinopolyspora mzabensis]
MTGGSGFVGGHLVERLIERGDEVTVFDTAPPPGPLASENAKYVRGDIRDETELARVIRSNVDVIYHLAAVVGVDRYLSDPTAVIDTNFSGTRNVLDLATRAGAKVVLASTSEVFGKNSSVPWREDSDRVLGPSSAARWSYATGKALAEHLAFSYRDQHGLELTVVRYFNAYGPGQRPAYLVSRSVHRALNGRAPVIYDGGGQTRCFTFVQDVVEGTVLAGTRTDVAGESFNIGSGTETTIARAVRLIGELTGANTEPLDVDTGSVLGDSYEDLPRRVPDSTKARQMLGWSERTSLREGLRRTIEWARASPWWLALPEGGAG